MNPEERDEDLLQEYLKGDSALSRLYRRNADEQPDAQLDARILAQARRGVARKSRVPHSPFARHWMVPTSLAAVLVLSLSVVLLMPDPALEPAVEPAVKRDRAAEPALAPADDDTPKPAETVKRREATSDAEKGTTGERAPDTLRRQSPAVDHRADQPVGQTVGKSGEKRKSVATERKGVVGGEAGSRSAAPTAGVAEEAAASAALRPLPEPVPAPRPMPADAVQADPAAWLRFIESLLNEQNREGATSNLRAFRTRYPDFPLPAALMPLAASLDADRP